MVVTRDRVVYSLVGKGGRRGERRTKLEGFPFLVRMLPLGMELTPVLMMVWGVIVRLPSWHCRHR